MSSIELKIPPPLLAFFLAACMWIITRATSAETFGGMAFAIPALMMVAVSGVFGLGGILAFLRVRTTVNPHQPHNASTLVVSGIYRFSRNPMYVSVLFLLIAWAIALAEPLALIGPIVFVPYMTRFQIVPEERALAERFGEDYRDYMRRVHRWL
jgi:protein-S-isoprenylcysteine O-methyltransferase Ste14